MNGYRGSTEFVYQSNRKAHRKQGKTESALHFYQRQAKAKKEFEKNRAGHCLKNGHSPINVGDNEYELWICTLCAKKM